MHRCRAYEFLYSLREYLTIDPDGALMQEFRKQHWFPFSVERMSDAQALAVLQSKSTVISSSFDEALKKTSNNSEIINIESLHKT